MTGRLAKKLELRRHFSSPAKRNPMLSNGSQREPVLISDLTNREFLELYARPGRIGLSGGVTLVDKAICRAERHLHAEQQWGLWSHAFIFQGERADGHHWLIDSDMQVHRTHIQLAV